MPTMILLLPVPGGPCINKIFGVFCFLFTIATPQPIALACSELYSYRKKFFYYILSNFPFSCTIRMACSSYLIIIFSFTESAFQHHIWQHKWPNSPKMKKNYRQKKSPVPTSDVPTYCSSSPTYRHIYVRQAVLAGCVELDVCLENRMHHFALM